MRELKVKCTRMSSNPDCLANKNPPITISPPCGLFPTYINHTKTISKFEA